MDYRLYVLNPQGHIVDAVELDCDGDFEATRASEPYREQGDLELWQRARKVRQLPKVDA